MPVNMSFFRDNIKAQSRYASPFIPEKVQAVSLKGYFCKFTPEMIKTICHFHKGSQKHIPGYARRTVDINHIILSVKYIQVKLPLINRTFYLF